MNLLRIFLMWSSFLYWTPEGTEALTKAEIIRHTVPCQSPAWYYEGSIHLCPPFPDSFGPNLLHETQHFLAHGSGGLDRADYEKFARLAMRELMEGPYTKSQIRAAKHMNNCGAYELHAELPGIVEGNIPIVLQRWYPWFDLAK